MLKKPENSFIYKLNLAKFLTISMLIKLIARISDW
jgi:hypothetical protein